MVKKVTAKKVMDKKTRERFDYGRQSSLFDCRGSRAVNSAP